MLENMEMMPGERLGVVVAKDRAGALRTADRFPQTGGCADLQKDRPAGPLAGLTYM